METVDIFMMAEARQLAAKQELWRSAEAVGYWQGFKDGRKSTRKHARERLRGVLRNVDQQIAATGPDDEAMATFWRGYRFAVAALLEDYASDPE